MTKRRRRYKKARTRYHWQIQTSRDLSDAVVPCSILAAVESLRIHDVVNLSILV